jgi:membrane associated rhomboid family serine protease
MSSTEPSKANSVNSDKESPQQPADASAGIEVKPSSFKDHLRAWFLYRLPAALFWYWIILVAFGKELPAYITFERIYLVLPVGVAWVLLVLAHKWWRVLSYPFYALGFPLWMFFILCIWLFVTFRKTIKHFRFIRVVTSGAMIFLLFITIVIGWLVALFAYIPNTRATAALVAHTAIYLLFLQSFRWAANPFRPLLAFVRFLSVRGRKILEDVYINPGLTGTGSTRETAIKTCDWCLKMLDKFYASKEPLNRGVTSFTHRTVLPAFIYGFIFLYLLLATSFSLTLYEIERAWSPLFTGLGANATRFTVPNALVQSYTPSV